MSLGIVVKGPSGLVVAADSRVTLTATPVAGTPYQVTFDNASKLLTFSQPHSYVAAVTYGQAVVPEEQRTADSYLPELQASLPQKRVGIAEFSDKLSDFYMTQWQPAVKKGYKGPSMVFLVAGFDEGAPYGRLFMLELPTKPKPVEQLAAKDEFGVSWGGQTEIVDRITKGWQAGLPQRIAAAVPGLSPAQVTQLDQALASEQLAIPINVMALQDSVNLALTLIRTTIAMQQLSLANRGVGGPIDIVTITRTAGVKAIRFKEITADE